MCLAAFQAFWGKAYKYFPLKTVFLTCITIFEIGSLVVAVAPSSTVIIVGRAIQGAGGAGITGGSFTILAFITEPKHLHKVMGHGFFESGVDMLLSLGPGTRWCLYPRCQLEMVFLCQLTSWRHRDSYYVDILQDAPTFSRCTCQAERNTFAFRYRWSRPHSHCVDVPAACITRRWCHIPLEQQCADRIACLIRLDNHCLRSTRVEAW